MTGGTTLSLPHWAELPPPEEPAGWSGPPASVARMYNHLLGGKDNYAADRELAERATRKCPILPRLVQANRGFLEHAAAALAADAGLRQFIDIGCGLPATANVGDIVRRTDPSARVAYLDNDPMVLAHARALLAVDAGIGAVEADVRDPGALLAAPELRRLIDLDEPAGVFLAGVLDFIADADDPRGILAALAAGLAPGSHIVVTHAERSAALEPLCGPGQPVDPPFRPRTADEIAAICGSLRAVRPYPVRLRPAAHGARPVPLIGYIGRVPG